MFFVSLFCYGAIALLSIIFGIIYLTRPQFMPYHSLALGKSWSEVEPHVQTLILALMRVAGGGWLAAGLTILILLAIPFQAHSRWAIYTIPAIALITSCGSFYATYLVKSNTPGNPPFRLSLLSIGLAIIGFIFSIV